MSRCTARRHPGKGRPPQRCNRDAVDGLTVCEKHGAAGPRPRRKAELVVAKRELDGLVQPIPMDDPEADPSTAIHRDYRRTVARIRFLEGKVAELTADDLVWGKTKEEHVGASEFTGTNTTYEAGVSVWERLLAAERDHLLKVTDLMAKTHFKAAELVLQQRAQQTVYELLQSTLPALGHDFNDPETRRALTDVLTQRIEQREIGDGT